MLESRLRTPTRFGEQLMRGACWGAALAVVAVFGWLLIDVLGRGARLLSWPLLLEPSRDAGRAGGLAGVLVATLLLLLVCLVVALPLGIGTAVYLSELAPDGSSFRRLVRRSLDLLASVPSIIFGLFGMVVFCRLLGMGYSILAGGLTLACMVLPLLVQTSYAGLRAVPVSQRRAAAALGLSRITTLRSVVLPAARRSIVVGTMLASARALAETAALIFTSGYVSRMPRSLFDAGRSLSVHIYDLALHVPGGEDRAHASACVLLLLLLAINGTAHALARSGGSR